ncbi:MAG: CapA family protein, partial [Firmicutes bacterium]|nr:CapA family protein [Bacillota bacterium]
IQRRIPDDYEGFDEVKQYIKKGDVRFFNLETTISDGEFFANQYSGGSYLRAEPAVLDDAKRFGFNIMSFANNHSMDFSHDGLMATKKAIDERGIPNAGAGANLDEASAPVYFDTKNGRVALISVVSTMMNEAAMAGRQSRRFKGRPGVNGLRIDEHIEVTPQLFKAVKEIAELSNVNAEYDIVRAEGYLPQVEEGTIVLKNMVFKQGDKTKYVTHPNKSDTERVLKAIYEAQMQADYILVSVHSHELSGNAKENPADFLCEFAHKCIDCGAHAIIGHGPHLLRPIELYKNRPIFYSLGDFIIHNENIPYAPCEMYESQGLTDDATMRELFYSRSKGYKRGLMRDRRMLESIIPYFEFEDGELKYIELMPIELNFDKKEVWQKGNPRFSDRHGIIERLAEMSKPFGTKIRINEKGFGVVGI